MRYNGKIIKVSKNHGVIESLDGERKVKYFFYLDSDRISGDKFICQENVTFKLSLTQIRGTQIKIAFDLKGNKEEEEVEFKITTSDRTSLDYHDFIFREFYQTEDENVVNILKDIDIEIKELVLRWVLFLEDKVRELLVNLTELNLISTIDIYNHLSKSSSTKRIHKDIFKTLGNRYAFRKEFDLLDIVVENPQKIEVLDAPLSLYLEQTTVDELGKILNEILLQFDFIEDGESRKIWSFLRNIKDMFPELSLIRNSCAHGNPFLPMILDDAYLPSYLYDLSSQLPNFISGDDNDVRKWTLFENLRWATRQATKRGLTFFGIFGLQDNGLYMSKYILINPARRSFFAFLFVINLYLNSFYNQEVLQLFKNDLKNILPYFQDDEKHPLANFPSGKPVLTQLFKFTYPIFIAEFWVMIGICPQIII